MNPGVSAKVSKSDIRVPESQKFQSMSQFPRLEILTLFKLQDVGRNKWKKKKCHLYPCCIP